MDTKLTGIQHVTAIAGDPQQNIDFYTDIPGFSIDEKPEELGASLKLPPWYEPSRAQIEAVLVSVKLPARIGKK